LPRREFEQLVPQTLPSGERNGTVEPQSQDIPNRRAGSKADIRRRNRGSESGQEKQAGGGVFPEREGGSGA
jgi:hypothetical protein